MSLSVYSTRNLTFPPKKYNEEAKRGVNISAYENCGKTSKKTKRWNEHVKSCGLSFASDQCEWEFASKKILNGQKKAKHTIELKNVSYVKNALKTNQEEIGTKLLTTK